VLGIDIGARYLRMAVADVTGTVRAREDVLMGKLTADGVFAVVPDLARRLVATGGVPAGRIAGAIVGVPGVVDPSSGEISLAENVPGLEGERVSERLERDLAMPVKVLNDVNLAAIGERDEGAGRGVESFVFVSVGTGLGAGVIVGGELVAGSHGAAGELDLMRPAASGEDPAAPAIRAYAAELRDGRAAGRAPSTVEIFAKARKGEQWALDVVAEVARRICAHLIPIAAIIDPELIVLGGGIGANGDLLLAPVSDALTQALPFPPAVQSTELRDEAVLAGALALGAADAREWSFERGE
jgi:predicted NBD/HSP70 family sugar kinase